MIAFNEVMDSRTTKNSPLATEKLSNITQVLLIQVNSLRFYTVLVSSIYFMNCVSGILQEQIQKIQPALQYY